ncbi:hypothetical protein ElyMa_007046500 [Elysia marginata]|uniref:GIY-YIG domain-containing protein n=1 Tax=Elysia marginata TaxID=1093978 RepID=A0AAV4JV14_9GAST|nr:hypothetical protein ElyMa_007046500 [Elysia marginata]
MNSLRGHIQPCVTQHLQHPHNLPSHPPFIRSMQKGYTGAAPDDCISPTHQHQCPYTSSTSSFRSSINGRIFNITLKLSCHSHNIIYLITCTKCNKKYIGKTKKIPLRTRFTSHRFDINNDRGTSVAKHFNLDDHAHQHVNTIAIDQLPGSDNISLLNKETHWIHTLGTTEPHGMNIKEQESFPISIRFK